MSKNARRKSRKKKSMSTRSMAKMALSKINNMQESTEIKYYDESDFTQLNFDDAGIVRNIMSELQQGIDSTSRIGDEVSLQSIDFRYMVTKARYASPNNITQLVDRVRVVLFIDKTNIVNNSSQLFDKLGSPLTTLSQYRRSRRNDFNIIYNKVHTLSENYHPYDTVFKFIDLKGMVQRWTVGDNPAITENSIKLCIIGDIPNGNSDGVKPLFDSFIRIRYTDK